MAAKVFNRLIALGVGVAGMAGVANTALYNGTFTVSRVNYVWSYI